MILVVDASVAVEYLLKTRLGMALAPRLDRGDLAGPDLIDAETLAVLRRAFLQRRITAARAVAAVEDLRAWPLRRLPSVDLLLRAWRFRHNASAYDALYLAAAASLEAPLLTADARLGRSSVSGVLIETVRV